MELVIKYNSKDKPRNLEIRCNNIISGTTNALIFL